MQLSNRVLRSSFDSSASVDCYYIASHTMELDTVLSVILTSLVKHTILILTWFQLKLQNLAVGAST